MTADSESVAKHAALHPVHLDEQMSVTQLVRQHIHSTWAIQFGIVVQQYDATNCAA